MFSRDSQTSQIERDLSRSSLQENRAPSTTGRRYGKGSFIYDILALGGGGQGFCDDSTKAIVTQSVMMGGGLQKVLKICSKFAQNCVTSYKDHHSIHVQ